MKKRHGSRVAKISVDAGFSCPNRDGALSSEGCVYCDNRAFSYAARNEPLPLEEQIRRGEAAAKERTGAGKYIIYFQAFTNTYAPLHVLRERYDAVRKHKDVVGISIGTRPDCVDDEKLALIASYTDRYDVWVEYGLQSVHDRTLAAIDRGHDYAAFVNAVKRTRKHPEIKIAAHVIIGLPGETKADMLETAQALGDMAIDGVKIHPLHVIAGTRLEELYRDGSISTLEIADYVATVVSFIERLSPETVIQRLTADCPADLLVSPLWIRKKREVLSLLEREMARRDTRQGRLCYTGVRDAAG